MPGVWCRQPQRPWRRGAFSSWPGAREGRRAALLAVTAFAVFPLTIRYGRAFQPDALALGACLRGLACWDRYREGGRRPWMVIGWCLLATGFAVKITAAFLLVPLLTVVRRPGRRLELVAACATLVPAGLWYAWAVWLLAGKTGSRASADNQSFWLEALGPVALCEARDAPKHRLGSLRSGVHTRWARRWQSPALCDARGSIGCGARGQSACRWPCCCSGPSSIMSITGCRWRPWQPSGWAECSIGWVGAALPSWAGSVCCFWSCAGPGPDRPG